jgi:hypothetical protein
MRRRLERLRQAKPLPWVATGCRGDAMVRRGSTVRVRQRALQKSRKAGLSFRIGLHFQQRALGMEPIMELSDPQGRSEAGVFVRMRLACAAMADWAGERTGPALHPTGPALAQRLHRVVQQPGARRMPQHQHVLVTGSGARVVISDWKADYNHRRRHSALGYRAPAVYAAARTHP